MADSSQILNDAYQYIEDGDFQAARELLEEHREENENNPDFWWVYAHAVETDEEGQAALQRLLELDPEYPGARTLLSQITPPSQPTVPAAAPPLPPLDDAELTGDDFADLTEDDFAAPQMAETRGSTSRNLIIGVAAVIILTLLGLLLIPSLFGGAPDVTPTSIIAEEPTARPIIDDEAQSVDPSPLAPTTPAETEQEPTDLPASPTEADEDEEPTQDAPLFATTSDTDEAASATPEETEEPTEAPTETEELPTETPTASSTPTPTEVPNFGLEADTLEAAGVPEDGLNQMDTTLGNTLVFTICAAPGPQASEAISNLLDILIEDQSDLPTEFEAFGFAITDCDADTVFRTIGVEREAFEDVDGTTEELQGALRPIN